MGLTTNDAGEHNHTIDPHNHVATVHMTEQDTLEAGEHKHEIEEHSHPGGDWMPNVNDTVLVLFAYGFNTDGFILGVIA